MHDLNAIALKHEQAVRNTGFIECHKRSTWNKPAIIFALIAIVTIYVLGV